MHAIEVCTTAEQMEGHYLAATVQLAPSTATPLQARVTRVELDDLWINRSSESASRVKHASQSPHRAFVKFLTRPGDIVVAGQAVPFGSLIRHAVAHSYFEKTAGPTEWGALSLPIEQFVSLGMAINGRDPLRTVGAVILTPQPDVMQRLLDLHSSVAAIVEQWPELLSVPAVAHNLQQTMTAALFESLNQPAPSAPRLAGQLHEIVMRRFWDVIEENSERPIYIPEICLAIRVPERTLRLCCQEHLGMSPKQFLLLRRLDQTRRALTVASPHSASVTEIATQHGFWHFGRFAGSYRTAFGETPSATLRRTSGDIPRHATALH